MLLNTVCVLEDGKDEVVEDAAENEKMGLGEAPVFDPKTIGEEFVVPNEDEDAPKENPVEEDEVLKVEPKIGDFGACQLEPKELELAPPELTELASEEEAGLLAPKLKILGAVPLLEITALAGDEEAEELATKLNIPGDILLLEAANEETEELAPKLNIPGDVLLLEIADKETEELVPKVNIPVDVLLLEVADEEAEELAPTLKKLGLMPLLELEEAAELTVKLNVPGIAVLLLIALTSEEAEDPTPNLKMLGVPPLLELTRLVSDVDAEL